MNSTLKEINTPLDPATDKEDTSSDEEVDVVNEEEAELTAQEETQRIRVHH